MRKILAIALNNLRRFSRDRSALFLFLLMPLLLTGILGISLGPLMKSGQINPFAVIILNEDRPVQPPGTSQELRVELGRILTEEVLGSYELRSLIQLREGTSLETAKAEVSHGEAAAAIWIPPDYSAAVLQGQQPTLSLYTNPAQPTQAAIVTEILQAFSDQVAMETTTAMLTGKTEARPGSGVKLPRIERQGSGLREVGAMAYYAAAMAVMYMLMSAILQAKLLLQDQESGLLSRLITTPTQRWQVIAGQMLSSLLLIGAQFLILLIGSRLIYGVIWGAWLPVLLLGLSFALAASGIGTGLATLFRDHKAADSAVGLLGMLFGALSGSMFPLYQFPEGMLKLARFVPNYWALQGLLDQMAGRGAEQAIQPILILCTIGLLTGLVGGWRLALEGR